MNKALRFTLVAAGFAFATQAAAQVTFYEREGYQGRTFTTSQRIANFSNYGFNDRASAAVVSGTRWEVCNNAQYGGTCTVLRPGSYPSLAALGLNDRVSSARPIAANARISESRYAPMPVTAQVTFYESENFGGRSFVSGRQVANFQRFGFNDAASSVEVIGERWEVCEDRQYRGRCVVLRPGRYPSLRSMGLNDRVSSVRIVAGSGRIAENRYAPAFATDASARRDYRRRNQERVYEANVISARAVVGADSQRCWIEREQVQVPAQSGANVPGAVVGAIIGGILGHQVGSGSGNDIATVGGAAAGGFVGSQVGRTGGQATQIQDVQKCATVPSTTPTYWDVTYNFRGVQHRVQMTSQPGATVTVNEQVEPRT